MKIDTARQWMIALQEAISLAEESGFDSIEINIPSYADALAADDAAKADLDAAINEAREE
ncbi:MAG: hypothetical protein ACU843_07475 [Gammaproteobacteria bacterium]